MDCHIFTIVCDRKQRIYIAAWCGASYHRILDLQNHIKRLHTESDSPQDEVIERLQEDVEKHNRLAEHENTKSDNEWGRYDSEGDSSVDEDEDHENESEIESEIENESENEFENENQVEEMDVSEEPLLHSETQEPMIEEDEPETKDEV